MTDTDSKEIPLQEKQVGLAKKLGSALFYGFASFLLTVVNKTVLTSWEFKSFLVLSIGQLGAAIIVLYVAKQLYDCNEFDLIDSLCDLIIYFKS